METKLAQLRKIWANDKQKALLFAAKFSMLGKERDAILLAKDCIVYPAFYKQLKKDLPACIEAGIEALQKKYKL